MPGPRAWYVDEDLIDVYKVLLESRSYFADVHGPLCLCGCPDRKTDDVDWAAEIGRRDWAVITHDTNILNREEEWKAFRAAGLGVFFFAERPGGPTLYKWDRVRLVLRRFDEFVEFFELEPRPFFAKFSKSQRPTRLADYD